MEVRHRDTKQRKCTREEYDHEKGEKRGGFKQKTGGERLG